VNSATPLPAASQTLDRDTGPRFAVPYSLSAGGASFIVLPLSTVLVDVFARFHGLSLEDLSWLLALVGILASAVSPVLGILADQYSLRNNGRKNFVVASLLCMTVAGFELMYPLGSVGVLYFLFWNIVLRFAQISYDVAHLAWGAELAKTHHDSTRLFSVRTIISCIGAVMFYAISILPGYAPNGITPEVLRREGIVIAILMIPILHWTMRYVPNIARPHPSSTPATLAALRQVLSNRPFRTLVWISVLLSIGEGMWVSLSFVVYDYYYSLGTSLPKTYIISYSLTATILPLISKLCAVRSKKLAFALLQLAFIVLISVSQFAVSGTIGTLIRCSALIGVQIILLCNFVVINALLADSIDYGKWRHGVSNGATYFAASGFLAGVAGSIGSSSGLFFLARSGFSSQGVSSLNDARAGTLVAFYLVPALTSLVAIPLIMRFPIGERGAAAIRRRLAARAASAA